MEMVVFCGIQGAGKSTFYRDRFFNTHIRINLDMLRTRHREEIILHACLAARQPLVIDNTNPTADQRRRYARMAAAAGFRAVACFFDIPLELAIERNAARPGKAQVPEKAIRATFAKLQPPTRDEGFDAIHRVTSPRPGEWEITPYSPARGPG